MAPGAATLSSWLRTPTGALVFALAWLVFAVAFAAATWFGRPVLSAAAAAAARVVTPAAMLGLVAIRLNDLWPLRDRRRRWLPALHLVLAPTYALLWTASVSLTGSILTVLQGGGWSIRTPPEHVLHWHLLTGVLLYVLLVGSAEAYREVVGASRERHAAEARLAAAQLNPHFLANTLHSLATLIRLDADKGEEAFHRLNELLKYVLRVQREERQLVRFDEEWQFIRQYLALEELGTDGRLRVTLTADDDVLDMTVPPLLLQPLVENAVQHGIRPRPDGGTVTVSAAVAGDRLVLEVTDDGVGTDLAGIGRGTGLGLRAVHARLAAYCGLEGALHLSSRPGHGFVSRIEIPLDVAVRGNRPPP